MSGKSVFLLSTFMAAALAAMSIMNVPYHRQVTEYSCGAASLEMLLHFSAPDVDQRGIIDVIRTSPYQGTLRFLKRQ
jgi:hypothetical protein